MQSEAIAVSARPSALGPAELRALQQRSNARGLSRLLAHLLCIATTAVVYGALLERGSWLALPACLAYGFTLVTMFAAMHECVHRTAFKSRALNDGVGFFAGVLSFYNSTFYRYYHGWHHRFTQIAGRDPELEDERPATYRQYLVGLSGVTWWVGKLRTHARLALGRVAGYGFLNEENGRSVVRSVRWQLGVYLLMIALSVALRAPLFLWYWLIPVAVAQPLLRAILLAEHTDCSEDDDPHSNTRTTYTTRLVRLLMWDMPYHAEHHRYPALPFFALARAHEKLGPELSQVARAGYSGFHRELWRRLGTKA